MSVCDDREPGLRRDREVEDLTARLSEAEDTLRAIRKGDVDAVLVDGATGPEVYTLHSADRPYRIIVERMQEGALTLSPDATILYANRSLATLLRVPLEKIVGERFQRFVHAGDRDRFEQLLAESGNGGGRSEIILRATDGTSVPVHLSAVVLPEEGHRVISVIVTDLTVQKQRTIELAESNARLAAALEERERAEGKLRQAQKMEAVGQLTAGIAHDFNNLMTVIAGNLDLMQARVVDAALQRQIEAIQTALHRSVRLTDQLLAFSRQRTLRPRPISVNALLRDAEPLLRRAVGDEIRVKLQFGDDVGECFVDPSELQASMLNLAINAKDAMSDGGSLRITTAQTQFAGFPNGTPGSGGVASFVAVTVTDTGHGMTAEIRDRAFDPFFTTKDVGKGTGLGLSQVYGFMRQSGGHVSIESEVGAGTTVRLYLPRTEERALPEERAETGASPAASPSRRILVVEDDEDVRRFVTLLLRDIGYTALEAETGPAALRLLQDNAEVDLVFTDVRMPDGMSGFQLAQEIRGRLPDVAIVLTSGVPAFPDQMKGMLGNWPILRKPYRRDDIVQVIEEALSQRRARSATA
jgi:PAS domain S-box-containing protein